MKLLLIIFFITFVEVVQAQSKFPTSKPLVVKEDSTLGTQVRPENGNFNITHGTQVNRNLFHSFKQFSIPPGSSAIFQNASNIENIFSRVTGGHISQIEGIIKTQVNGANIPNLFLINPNGIIFGNNAQIMVGGSFIATTANQIDFPGGNNTSFSADLNNRPLLTSNLPIGLTFRDNSGEIVNRSNILDPINMVSGLAITNNTIALLGNKVIFEGGHISSISGNVEIGSINSPAHVAISYTQNGLRFNYDRVDSYNDILLKKNVSLDEESIISATSLSNIGGDIQLRGKNIIIKGVSQVTSSNLSSQKNLGNIILFATDNVEILEESTIFSISFFGRGGDISIHSKQLLIRDQDSFIQTLAFMGLPSSPSQAGNIVIHADELVELDADGNSNVISVQAASINTTSGNLTIETDKLILKNGGFLTGTTNASEAGSLIDIKANFVNISGSGEAATNGEQRPSGIFSRTIGNNSVGRGGLININTNHLELTEGGMISVASTSGSQGTAGIVTINARESLLIDGNNSALLSTSEGEGNSGDLIINSPTLIIQNGARVSASSVSSTGGDVNFRGVKTFKANEAEISATTQTGIAGSLNINRNHHPADLVQINNSTFAAQAEKAGGNAGSVTVNTSELDLDNQAIITTSNIDSKNGGDVNLQNIATLRVSNNSEINASTLNGRAGSLRINQGQQAANRLDLNSGNLTVAATGSGDSGSLEINAKEVNLNNSSEISASTNSGTGGNIELFGLETLHVNNSNVTTSTQTGQAGDLNIETSRQVNVSGQNSQLAAQANQKQGVAGNVNIDTRELNVENGASVSASNIDDQNGGDINLQNIETLKVSNGGQIEATTEVGKAGSLRINQGQQAANRIELDSGKLTAEATGNGDSGSLEINAKEVNLDNNSQVSASTTSGTGGNIELFGLEILDVNNSNVTASTKTGQAGDLNIEASKLVQVSDKGILSVEADNGGNAGTLSIKSPITNVYDGSEVSVSSEKGQAGNLTISGNQLYLNQGTVSAETGKSEEESANITLNLSDLVILENESAISAEAFENADGGNILINTPFLIVDSPTGPNGSDIIAGAERGSGGNIFINSYGVFGTAERIAIPGNQTNDIDASSQFGSPGQVQLNSTIDPNRGVIQLSEEVVDPDKLVAQNPCKQGKGSQFNRTGRGGLPPTPSDNLSSEATQVELVQPAPFDEETQVSEKIGDIQTIKTKKKKEIIPAQGWVFNEKGEVVLTAYNPTVTAPQRLKTNPESCPAL